MMRLGRFLLVAAAVALLTVVNPGALIAVASPMSSSPMGRAAPEIQPWLATQLARTGPSQELTVLVHGRDLTSARAAVARSGLTALRDLNRIAVTIARGTPAEVQLAARQPGVTYVEGNQPIELHLGSSHEATRGEQASTSLARDGGPLDGAGVSVAVIDTGIDPTHPFFTDADGASIVVANLKNVCGVIVSKPDTCFVDAGPMVDTDTTAAGGHGTHVNGIVAGQPVEMADGEQLRGAAPGARLVSLSMGSGLVIINAYLGLEWVLEHHAAPCGADVSAEQCPPIKAVNNSYGPAGGGDFNPLSAAAKLQQQLAAEGVVTVWANGNGGGDGSSNRSNPPGQDPTPGIISVASYFDQNTGTRDGAVSGYSSRGDQQRPKTWPDISAPGESITSACRPYLAICSTGTDFRSGASPTDVGAYNTISGTSMAAPHISGIVAQLFQADPTATAAEVEHALKSTAHRYTDGAAYRTADGYSTSYDKGTGLVDVAAAIPALPGWVSANEVEPASEPVAVKDSTPNEASESRMPSGDRAPSDHAKEDEQRESGQGTKRSASSSTGGSAADISPTTAPAVKSKGTEIDNASTAQGRGQSDVDTGTLWWIGTVAALLGASALYLVGARRSDAT